MAAADVLYEIMTMMVKKGPLSKMIKSNSEEVSKADVDVPGMRVNSDQL